MNREISLIEIVEIAEHAGKVLLNFQKDARKLKMDKKDFLTDADLKSNNLIIAKLKSLDPKIPIYSEESNEILAREGIIWVVDPLDGTVNFFHQDFHWGVSIALVKDGKTKLGVVCLPFFDQVFGTTEDKIFVKNESLSIRKERRLSEAQIWTDWGKESEVVLSLLPKLKRISLYPQIRLCATASLMAVATGKICAYIHPHPAPEDFAAAALIVEKAGGKVTDLENNPWDVFSSSIIASNGILHEQILREINS